MFSIKKINERGAQIISNIYINLKKAPNYQSYYINFSECIDFGGYLIELTKNLQPVNMFLFFPKEDNSGNIGSIAIYGKFLEGHYKSIKNSMKIFGLPVIDIEINSGESDYIDIQIGDY